MNYPADEYLDKLVESVTGWGKLVKENPESRTAAKIILAIQCEIYLRAYTGGWFKAILYILKDRWNLKWHPRWLLLDAWLRWIEKRGKIEWRTPFPDIPKMRERHRVGCTKSADEEAEKSCIDEITPLWLLRMFNGMTKEHDWN